MEKDITSLDLPNRKDYILSGYDGGGKTVPKISGHETDNSNFYSPDANAATIGDSSAMVDDNFSSLVEKIMNMTDSQKSIMACVAIILSNKEI